MRCATCARICNRCTTTSRRDKDTTMRRRRLFLIGPFAILAFAAFLFLGGEAIKYLWNWLLPPIAGWHIITFWQAMGLLALCRLLFGGFGRGGGFGMRRRMA